MIHLQSLKKSFKGKPALHGLSFTVEKGEIFGLLGHNGAGKSTALGIMLGQVYPDSGEAFISRVSVQRDRPRALERVGAIFEAPRFYEYLSGWTNLQIFTSYSARLPKGEIMDAVKTVGLEVRIHDKVGTYSQGMRQRLGLAQALLPAPEVVLLDEPTNGLDPEGIAEMRALIQQLNKERGLTMLFCSHLLSEVEQLCDRVAILNQGRLVFSGRWNEIAGNGKRYRLDLDNWEKAAPIVGSARKAIDIVEIGASDDVAELVAALVGGGVKVRAVEPLKARLEELYLETVQSQ